MEEKKLKQAKSKVEGESSNQEKPQRLSYEQLNNICSELYQQNQNLQRQLQQANMVNMFKRLDYLFLVLKYEGVFKDPDFVNECIDEIKGAIIVKPEDDVVENKEGN